MDKTYINLSVPLSISNLRRIDNHIFKSITSKDIEACQFNTSRQLLLEKFISRLSDTMAKADGEVDLQLTFQEYTPLNVACNASTYDLALLFERTQITELSRFVVNKYPNLISVKDAVYDWPHCFKYLSTRQCELLVSYLQHKTSVTNDLIIDGLLEQNPQPIDLEKVMEL